jgi:Lon protease-like protein
MINYNDLPLFPLHTVLYPEMPLPLHIFEPRYREMVRRCREDNSPFGIVLIQTGEESDSAVFAHSVGTTARITHLEEMPDGCMNILVTGETRFLVLETQRHYAYLTARAQPLDEPVGDPQPLAPLQDAVGRLFKDYVRSLFTRTGRTLSTLQLPQDPCHLSYAIATFLPIGLSEKQRLLEAASAEDRMEQEIEILGRELEAQASLETPDGERRPGVVLPVDSQALARLSSRN